MIVSFRYLLVFCFNDTTTTVTDTYCHPLALHDALPSFWHVGNSGAGTLTVSDGGTVSLTFSLVLGNNDDSTGTLNIGAGGAPGTLDASAVESRHGTGTLNFNHTDAGYQFTTDGTDRKSVD